MTPKRNEFIKQAIIDQLTWDSSVNSNNVRVNVRNGKVELSGNVENMAARMAAERNAQEVQGVISVDNRLEIQFPPGSKLPNDAELKDKEVPALTKKDERIKEELTRAFKRTYLIDEEKIQVEVDKGNVQLSGKVPNILVKVQARNMATQTSGVREVLDNLSLA